MVECLAAIAAAKKHLRKRIADRLRYVSQDSVIEQSNKIADTVRSLPEYVSAKRIGLYMHMQISNVIPRKSGRNVEVMTDALIKHAFDDGKLVFLPRIVNSSELSEDEQNSFSNTQSRDLQSTYFPSRFLKLLKMRDYDAVQELVVADDGSHTFTIKEPSEGEDALATSGLDLIIIPGLVFSKACERIGRGKGFYDNFIELHRTVSQKWEKDAPSLVGIALREQLIREEDTADASMHEFPCEAHDQKLDVLVVESDVYRKSLQ
ncbi:hypothetical protein V1525DRAFT_59024 [Lipomyces kononenkoae]|uniref:Uncharacterized protein n=1 Tax=Lipomyces kononenkoae TaxID=34357 RepID=A0ACC3ST15_LIPKO